MLLMDKDPEAIAAAEREFGGDARVAIRRGSFADLARWEAVRGGLDGVLFDLGVSSPQLDAGERGFSFAKDGPLDMRMDPDTGESAAQWLARAGEAEIADVLYGYGEERQSRRIARAIVARRAQQPIERTADLAAIVAAAMPRGAGAADRGRIHPATRSFQAIRIFINRELADLEAGLEAAVEALRPNGRLVAISFHSLEDRIVKRFIAGHARAPAGNRRAPPTQDFVPRLIEIGGAQRADEDELHANPRARSAVLRVAERLGPGTGDRGPGKNTQQSAKDAKDAKTSRRTSTGSFASFAPFADDRFCLFPVPGPRFLVPACAGGGS